MESWEPGKRCGYDSPAWYAPSRLAMAFVGLKGLLCLEGPGRAWKVVKGGFWLLLSLTILSVAKKHIKQNLFEVIRGIFDDSLLSPYVLF